MAVTLGSSFGVVGMLLAVPLASVLYTLAKEFAEKRLKQDAIRSDEGGKS
jgi:predicted PurR-regulated permease PerM